MRAALAGMFLASASVGWAADVPITAEKLSLAIESRTDKLKVRFVSRDPAITKGAAGDPAQLAATVTIAHADDVAVQSGFITQPAYWVTNTATMAKYRLSSTEVDEVVVHRVNKIVVREGLLGKIVARGLIPTVLGDLPGAAGITVVLELGNGNDATSNRFCTRFSEADGSTVSLDPDYPPKFRAAGGVAVPCPALP